MRNRRADTPDFGSDSFLDIIANVVGILIIFILIAGIKARNAPVVAMSEKSNSKTDEAKLVEVVKVPKKPTVENEPPRPYRELTLPVPVLDFRETQQLKNELQIAKSDFENAQSTSGLLEKEIRSRELDDENREKQFAKLNGVLRQRQIETRDLSATRSVLQKDIDDLRDWHRQLISQYDDANRKIEKPPIVLRHKLNPVSKLVHGKEVHFHLSNNKIAFVPVERLIARMKNQIQRQKSWIMKFNRHRGRVGPERGFTMSYLVERGTPSVLDQLQSGYGIVRISLSEWRIDAEATVNSENERQALRPGSNFLQELKAVDPEATLTFWVYPDSFDLYRKLQRIVHREGYRVAARPLPFGVPIAGSPHGTKSAGQ